MKKYYLAISVFVFVGFVLSAIQLSYTGFPMLLFERFINGLGWVEIFMISVYGGIIAYKIDNYERIISLRKIIWSVFCIIFFSQVILGLLLSDKFLMTGKLHLPVPMMIIAGPLYRGHISIMTILFLSTILLIGPAWCSYLCYFGAIDNLAANVSNSNKKVKLRHKKLIKGVILFLVIIISLLLRELGLSLKLSITIAIIFGLLGIMIILLLSVIKGKMIHCIYYCPVGTVVNILRWINPFRLYINNNCVLCMKCSNVCKYDALNIDEIQKKEPNYSCSLCGDCLSVCDSNAIGYRFFSISNNVVRRIYFFLVISLHSIFLALARI